MGFASVLLPARSALAPVVPWGSDGLLAREDAFYFPWDAAHEVAVEAKTNQKNLHSAYATVSRGWTLM
jgi:hypothetical protein